VSSGVKLGSGLKFETVTDFGFIDDVKLFDTVVLLSVFCGALPYELL
jgi:hypothetical protein